MNTTPPRRGLRLEHVYMAIVLGMIGTYASLVPLVPNDYWWHLRVGQIIAAQGRVPTTNMFSWSIAADRPFVYGAWLAEWLFFQIQRLGGLELVIFTRNVLVLSFFALIGWEAQRRSGSWRLAALATTLVAAMSINNLIVRTQNWSWLPFMLFLIVLSRYVARQWGPRTLALLPLTMLFWVNAHGAYVLGLVLIGLFAAGETARRLWHVPAALTWREIAWLYGAGAATLAATLVNPRGWHIFGYVQTMMADQSSQKLVIEWQSPTPSGYANLTFFASTLLLLFALAHAQRRPSFTHVLVAGAFLWQAWHEQRSVVWYGCVAMPLLADALYRSRPRTARPARSARPSWLNAVLAGAVLLPTVLAQPWLFQQLPLPDGYRKQILPPPAPPLVATSTPVAAADWLAQHPGGTLFNEMGYGSYLIWAVPDQPVFIDPRVELYPLHQWEDYIAIISGQQSLKLLAQYGADRVLLNSEEQPKLHEVLAQAPNWRQEYRDQQSEIWTRR